MNGYKSGVFTNIVKSFLLFPRKKKRSTYKSIKKLFQFHGQRSPIYTIFFVFFFGKAQLSRERYKNGFPWEHIIILKLFITDNKFNFNVSES